MKYAYILSGIIDPDDPIKYYRLLSGNNMCDTSHCIRIRIPDDMKLTKLSCDTYHKTEDKRSLNDIGYDVLVKFNGRWKVRNDLKNVQPHAVHEVMMTEGYNSVKKLGFLTKKQYKAWFAKQTEIARQKRREVCCSDVIKSVRANNPEAFILGWTQDGKITYQIADSLENVIDMQVIVESERHVTAYIIMPAQERKESNHEE